MFYPNSMKESRKPFNYRKSKLFAYGALIVLLVCPFVLLSLETFGTTEYYLENITVDEEGFEGYTIIAEKDEIFINNVSIETRIANNVFIIETPKKIVISRIVSSKKSTVKNLIFLDYHRDVESVEITIKDSKIYTYDPQMVDFLILVSQYTNISALTLRIVNSTIVGDIMILNSFNNMYVFFELINSTIESNVLPICNVSALFFGSFFVEYTIMNSTISSPNAPEKSVYYSFEHGSFIPGTPTLIVERRILRNEYDIRSALVITLTTVFLTSLGVYIEHIYRKKEKIEEALGE